MGSRKRLAIVVGLLALATVACADGDASGNQATEAMENAGVDSDTARCIGNRLEDTLNQDQLNDVADASSITDLRGVAVPGTEDDLATVTRSTLNYCFEGGGDAVDIDDEADADG